MVIYVGSAADSRYDQVLEDVIITSVRKGFQMFEIAVAPPDAAKIPSPDDLLGVTVLMITALYRRQEFFRCSYFVYNNYKEQLTAEEGICLSRIHRSILSEKPRTRISEIRWEKSAGTDEASQYLSQFINRCTKNSSLQRSKRSTRKGKISKKTP